MHRKRVAILGFLGEILVYSTIATKATLFSSMIAVGIYYSIKRDRGGWVPKVSLLLAGFFFCLTTLVMEAKPGVLFNLASVSLVRTFAIPGMLIGQYQYFFETQPYTYLSTVTGFNLLTPNSYTLPLGVEVSAFFGAKPSSERGMANGNANLFATDGIAGFGLAGIPLAGLLCAAVLWILDSCAKGFPLEFTVSGLTMVIMSLANVSLFTALLGNGLIAWILLLLFMPRGLIGDATQPRQAQVAA
jgi:hypothetical protein